MGSLADRLEVAEELGLLTDPIEKPTSTALKKRLKDRGWSVVRSTRQGGESFVVGLKGDRFANLRGLRAMQGREPGVEYSPWLRRVEQGCNISLLVHDRRSCDAFLDEVLADKDRWFPKKWLK